ncbi:MAG: L-lactate permease [Intestinimonas massiliensis]|uniref:L-lactate permease n=1 Tax=Intestinimonas TaxID=1392389 RepID=UPI002430E13E|nr:MULTISPECIES: L-lactate permease [Intestinimonas]MCI5563465.1 L-lactate permease [Intestinimonas massiliensis (ex Afouda et al. 2020)]MDY5339481.1 L-lactate permease [Intestinimonas sp.]
MYAIIAAIPLILVIVLMIFVRWPALRSLAVGIILTAIVAVAFWGMAAMDVAAYVVYGFLSAIDNVIIIYGAILIMNTMLRSGGMAAINRMFTGITKDPRILTIIIGFTFGCFIEGAAGWGTPAALCAPLLIALGFPPLGAAMVCLMFNSVPVCFGAIGLPYTNAMSVISGAVTDLGGDPEAFGIAFSRMTGAGMAVGAPILVILAVGFLCKLFGKNKKFSDVIPAIPFCIFASLVFDVLYLAVLWVIGPQLPSLLGGAGTLIITLFAAKKGFLIPKDLAFEFGSDPEWESSIPLAKPKESPMKLGRAWFPYIVIAIWLTAANLPQTGMKPALQSLAFSVKDVMGLEGVTWKFMPLWNVGIIFIIICLLTAGIHGMKGYEVKTAMVSTAKQVWGAAVTVMLGIAMVNIYRYSNLNATGMDSMMLVMARSIADVAGNAFIVVCPFIGVLGSYMSGSNTVSNLLFSGLQFETATLLGLPQAIICAMQSNGGAIGNMVCVNNVVQVCGTTGTSGKEGKLISITIRPAVIYCLIIVALMSVVILTGYNPYPLG